MCSSPKAPPAPPPPPPPVAPLDAPKPLSAAEADGKKRQVGGLAALRIGTKSGDL